MHPPQVYTCFPSWTPLPPPSPYHHTGSSQCTSPKLPVSCIKAGLVIHFLYDIIHVSMPFSQIIPLSLSHRVQKTVLYICISFTVSHSGLSLPSFYCIILALASVGCSGLVWALKNWCFWTVVLEKTLESPLRSNPSIQKEISPACSLEGLMLKLKLQYFGHLMRRADSLEKPLMLGKVEERRRRGPQRMRWLDGSLTQWTWVWGDSGSWWWTGRPGMLWFMGSQRVGHNWATEQNWTELDWSGYRGLHFFFYENIIYIVDVATCLAGTDGKRTEFCVSGKLLAKDTSKNCMPSAATWVDLEIVIVIEVRERQHLVIPLYVGS